MNRATEPTPGPQKQDRMTQRIARAEATTDRRYVCLDCQHTVGEFPATCPECGAEAFRTATGPDQTPTLRDRFVQWLARTTGSLNPYIPR
jgi:hypothetical protein